MRATADLGVRACSGCAGDYEDPERTDDADGEEADGEARRIQGGDAEAGGPRALHNEFPALQT
jgi:hypothetical protein